MKQKGKKTAFLAALLFALTSVPLPADAAGSKDGSGTEKPAKAVSAVKGDIDLSGSVRIGDAVLFSRYLAEDTAIAADLTDQGLENADIDGDGFHTARDLNRLLKDLALLTDEPGEEQTTAFTETETTTCAESTAAGFGEEPLVTNAMTDDNEKTEETFAEWPWGDVRIFNIGMSEEENMRRWGIHAPKTVYQTGEELDLSNMILELHYGYGGLGGSAVFDPDLFEPEFLTDHPDRIEVDASGLDNTKPGIYTIYLKDKELDFVRGSFEVTVVDGDASGTEETTTAYNGEEIWTGFYAVWNYADEDYYFDPVKWVYRIGEELDLSNIILYGGGSISGGGNWDLFPPGGESPTYLTDAVESGWIEVDDSEFNNKEPGTYTIYMRDKEHPAVTGSFEVKVVSGCGEIWVDYNGYWKDTYLIGEELDIMDAPLYGCGEWPVQVADGEWVTEQWDAFGDDPLSTYVNHGFLELDTSEFDNTKPGTYTIRMRYTDGRAEGEFEVRVVESLETTATCETTLECHLMTTSDFIDGTYDEYWAKTIRYNLVADGTEKYSPASISQCNVRPGETLPVSLVVSNDQGTAGGRLYFDFDSRLKLGRSTKGKAYEGSFQWGKADSCLVWTCKDGHNQTAKDGAVIYTFMVTIPEDAKHGDAFCLDLNNARSADMSIRPEGGVFEAPDYPFDLAGLVLKVEMPGDTTDTTEEPGTGTCGCWGETTTRCIDCTTTGYSDDEGELYILNVDMPDSYSVEEYGMPAAKTAYIVGEELDLSNLYVYGIGSFENEAWTIRGPLSDYADIIEVDTADFNSKFTGKYEILLRRTDGIPAEGSFSVHVCGGEFRIANIGLADALDTNDEFSMERFGVHAPKLMYEIGEELDLSNFLITGTGYGASPVNGTMQNWKLKGFPLADLSDAFTVDASRFDNTKAGICAIDLIPTDPAYSTVRFWVSVGLYDLYVNQIGLDNGWGMLTIDDRNVKLRYALGEDLDIMQAPLVGFGLTEAYESREPHYWAILGESTLQDFVDEDLLKVDTNRYSKDSCGTYKIDLEVDELRHAWGEFDVEVYDGKAETTVSETNDTMISEGCETTLCESCESRTPEKPNDTYGDWWIDFSGFKTEYRIGEELDLEGLLDSGIYGAGMYYEWGEGEWIPVYWDAFGEETIRSGVKDGSMELDISAFDNTKPGTYMIHCSGRNVSESVEVKVIGDETCGYMETTCCESDDYPDYWNWDSTNDCLGGYDEIDIRLLNVNISDEESLEKYGVPAVKQVYSIDEEPDLSNLVLKGSITRYEHGYISYSEDLFGTGTPVLFSVVQDDFTVDTSKFESWHAGEYPIYLRYKKGATVSDLMIRVSVVDCSTGTGKLWLGDDPDDLTYRYFRSWLSGSPYEDRSWMKVMLCGEGCDSEGNFWVISDFLDEAVEAGWLEVDITETEDPDVYNVTMKRTDGIPAEGSFTLFLIDDYIID